MKVQSNKPHASKLSKAEMEAAIRAELSDPTKADLEEVSNATTPIGKGRSSKARSQRDKAAGKGVKRDWSPQGAKDAAMIWTADRSADTEKVKVLRTLSMFAAFGYGESTGKKQVFHEQTESYFNGWKKYKDSLPEAEQASFGVRYSEARRILNGYIVKGTKYMDDLLSGPGTYHQKVNSLPTMTGGGQGKGTRKGKAKADDKGDNVGAMSKAEGEQRIAFIAKFTEKEIGEVIANLPESQLRALTHAVAIRLAASSDPVSKAIGATMTKLLSEVEISEAKETAVKAGKKAKQA
jgi:hypothetical protein